MVSILDPFGVTVLGIENAIPERTLGLSFTRIGDVAARLIADPAKLQAAANEAPRMKGGDRPAPQGGDETSLSPDARFGGTARTEKKSGTTEPASGWASSEPSSARSRPVLAVVWSTKCLPTHRPSGSPTRSVGNHLVLVWNDVQADTTFRAGAL